MDISKIKISGTEYTLKDPVARGEETETEGISHITVDGTVYDCKDIVARGEGSANAKEISKVSVGGKVYQIKDDVARATYAEYFCVYSTDDDSLTFYGDDTRPSVGSQYNGKTVSGVYDFLDTGSDYPAFNDDWWEDMKSTYADPSAKGARPTSCSRWFSVCQKLVSVDLGNLDTSAVTRMDYMFDNCSSLTTLDVSNFDTSSVTTMSYMFYNCSSLTTIYSDDAKFVTTKVVSSDYMFTDCTKLVGGNGTAYDSSRVTYEMAHIDTEDNPGYFTDIKE